MSRTTSDSARLTATNSLLICFILNHKETLLSSFATCEARIRNRDANLSRICTLICDWFQRAPGLVGASSAVLKEDGCQQLAESFSHRQPRSDIRRAFSR